MHLETGLIFFHVLRNYIDFHSTITRLGLPLYPLYRLEIDFNVANWRLPLEASCGANLPNLLQVVVKGS